MNPITVRDLVLGDGSPKICVPVVAHTAQELEAALDAIDLQSCDLVEFRADFYFEEDLYALNRIRERIGERPILYTIRTKEEGGEIEIPEDVYEARILAAAPYTDLADIQLGRLHTKMSNKALHSTIIQDLHNLGVKVICSWHDFSGTPDAPEMVRKMVMMQEEGCDISKIAVMPRDRADVAELIFASLEMLETYADRPFITMSMGNLGRITRAAGAFTGSCITFGMAGQGSAPGQIPSSDLRQILQALG